MVSVTRVAGRSNNGFTLIELLLVLVILAALTALVMPRFSGRTRQARITTTRIDIFVNIPTALDLYEMDTGQYPTSEQGLDALIKEPRINPIPVEWNGPYLKRPVLPKDPWGMPTGIEIPLLNGVLITSCFPWDPTASNTPMMISVIGWNDNRLTAWSRAAVPAGLLLQPLSNMCYFRYVLFRPIRGVGDLTGNLNRMSSRFRNGIMWNVPINRRIMQLS